MKRIRRSPSLILSLALLPGMGLAFLLGENWRLSVIEGGFPFIWWSLLLLLLLFGLGLIFWVEREQKRRLSALIQMAEQMVPSAEEEKENPDDDEIGRLARLISRLESRLTREEQFRNQLIADAAHELRTPITILRGQLESFSAKEQVHPAQLLPLVDETMRMSRLIQDLQQLSLAEARKLSLHKSWLQLPLWLNEIFEVLKTEAEEKQIALEITQTANGEVYWDSSRMKQVLLNLIGNALQYTPRNGKVLISAQEYAGKIEIKIRDNGPGIPPEKLPYIFQRFYRVEGSRNRLSGGSGLGLAIAKEFVEIHEGKIRVESELGEGTTFTLEVPVFPETDSLR
ncbi:sensor histidine kinase [Paenactinomyces guangxiensis]|uniref:histidine kinase n=1 Tax=Paenactinomyces guangxiensis TaxID=1490290 RepID=A0A7W1WSV2_9BACL|nr:ATP-binding protein [Paenactinomyces guangxiensis]MBA4495445.1 hypothetical protein [Paenactinomyces guangxiensis]MBH8592432.1 hypothetical protein [Paenactinomyces guangxiensis]